MAQKALIVDSELLDVISSGRALIAGKEELIRFDRRMLRAGFCWDARRNQYTLILNRPPPIRGKIKNETR